MAKKIIFSVPVEVMSGSLSGRQDLEYGAQGGEAYDVPTGSSESATNYEPRLVAMYSPKKRRTYFQVRTRHTVNMTSTARMNLATMGGAGAIYAAIISDKESQLYIDCVHACPPGKTLRAWLVPILRPALAAKETDIVLADGLAISNPWNAGTGATVNIPQAILNKFASELGEITSPYNAVATAALMEALPDKWFAIREYGFNNPDIVPYINAFAPEDPKIAVSLVPGIGVRTLDGTGTAYLSTGVNFDADDEIFLDFDSISDSGNYALFGARNTEGAEIAVFWNGNKLDVAEPTSQSAFTWIHSAENIFYSGKHYELKYNKNACMLKDVEADVEYTIGINMYANFEGTRPVYLYAVNRPSIWHGLFKGRAFKVGSKFYGIPFKRTGGECGMIDLLTGTFCGNIAGSGSFTISETLV